LHQELKQPQRVDFLFTYREKRHIIEIDGKTHYRSEIEYRNTLYQERWLKVSGFEVHRFTNEEINELYEARATKPDGFIDLFEMMGINPRELVLVDQMSR
jgi:very-short-patch-repair endonuclease